MHWIHDDGGRAATGFKGETRDCVTRAIAIATGRPYREVYAALNVAAEHERGSRSNARTGVKKATIRNFMKTLGWTWHPTMAIGQGCKTHLRREELPGGRIVAAVSKHLVAVVDSVVHDTHDSTRDGTRCVYGYWTNA